MSLDFLDGNVELKAGGMFVVLKDVAEQECHVMLVEPAGTVNTGDTGADLTEDDNVWI